MKQIENKNISKVITEKYSYDFVLAEDGIYLIEIIASAKSWWQNFKIRRPIFKDDDIGLFLDRIEITSSASNKNDVRPAWNGNELKSMLKTVLIAVHLKKGKHALYLTPDQSPFLKSITISQVDDAGSLTYIPVDNNPAQKAAGRPWLIFVLINLAVQSLTVSAKANKRGRDDDDIKLIIDGEIQKNDPPAGGKNSHKDWYWCGKVSQGEKKFTKQVSWNGGLHYLDLYADESPFLYNIELALVLNSKPRIPTVDDPEWTGNFNDDPDEIILARLIFGEANGQPHEAKIWVAWSIINRTLANSWWPNTIQGVILQEGQYDPFKSFDKNYKKITNPLGFSGESEVDKISWHECYTIAREVIFKITANPTTATHFHGKGVSKKWFEAHIVPKGKFLKKIGDTYFYWSPN